MSDITLSNSQNAAKNSIKEWFWNYRRDPKNTPQVFRLFGLAGTGKTTLTKTIAEDMAVNVQYAAFAGKAALQMQKAGCHGASTIHSLIYKPRIDQETGVPKFEKVPIHEHDSTQIFIIDEVSMVDQSIGEDLLSFGKPILVMGDPGQLPPVNGAGFFVNDEPDVMLTEIHRQAADNPIIRLARAVREGEMLETGKYGDSIIMPKGSKPSKEDFLEYDMTICGRNVTRQRLNQTMRRFRGHSQESPDLPIEGERIIALKNDHQKGILNGTLYEVRRVPYDRIGHNFSMDLLNLDFGDGKAYVQVRSRDEFFDGSEVKHLDWRVLANVNHFDYGYALSCHKAQGSQWDSCLIFDESYCFREHWNRWLYTAITRAAGRFKMVL